MTELVFAVVVIDAADVKLLQRVHFTEAQQAAIVHIVRHRGQDPRPPAAEPSPAPAPPPPSPTDRVGLASVARLQGYTGDFCQNPLCGGSRMRRNGSCLACDDCGATTGCS